jgi:hypothetical protein
MIQLTKRMIHHRVVLASMLAMLTCLAHSAEPLKIGMVAPLTGSAAEEGRHKIQGAKLATEGGREAIRPSFLGPGLPLVLIPGQPLDAPPPLDGFCPPALSQSAPC